MGCGKEHHSGNCVCDILKEIARAQNDIVDICCDTSCEQSINDLIGETHIRIILDTVPLILYCKDDCKSFKGYGAQPDNIFNVISSFYYRVKTVDGECCVVIELLRYPHCDSRNPSNPIDQKTKHLRATGVCITVDLNCFCHVTFLPAILAFN